MNANWVLGIDTVLISKAEDRSRSARVKDKGGLPFEAFELTFKNRDWPELLAAQAFWDEHYPGKRFIVEDRFRNRRLQGYFDSDLRQEVDGDCAIDYSFRFEEGGSKLGLQFAAPIS